MATEPRHDRRVLPGQDSLFVPEKRCRECGDMKPLTEYPVASQNRDGLMYCCDECNRKKARAWTAANPERANENARRWREENPDRAVENGRRWYTENRERSIRASVEWGRANPERKRASARAWDDRNRETNRVKGREYWQNLTPEQRELRNEAQRAWKEANRAKVVADNHKRRLGRYDQDGIDYIGILHGDPCSYCGAAPERQTIDHITAITRDGPNAWENLTAACRSCNSSKSNASLLEFLLRREPIPSDHSR